MATVKIQALDAKNEWNTIAQLDHTEAQGYIDSFRSDHFLNAVEERLRTTAERMFKEGKLLELPQIEATHLRKIRADPNAFRVIPYA